MKDATISAAIPQLPTGNLDKTAEFYVKNLGFEVHAKYPSQKFMILKRGSAELHFWETSTEMEAEDLGRDSSCYIRVENIKSLYTELKNREAPFRFELTMQPWGMNEMQIDDPYGNSIKFGEPAHN